MFSSEQKRRIAEQVQRILRATDHPELPVGEITFTLHVKGAEPWSWANIVNTGAVKAIYNRNPHNEEVAKKMKKTKKAASRFIKMTEPVNKTPEGKL